VMIGRRSCSGVVLIPFFEKVFSTESQNHTNNATPSFSPTFSLLHLTRACAIIRRAKALILSVTGGPPLGMKDLMNVA